MRSRDLRHIRADGARAILVTPLAVAAPYWSKLLRASVAPNAVGHIRMQQQQQSALPDSDVPSKLAISAVDFSPCSNQRQTNALSPPFGMEAGFSGRDPRGSTDDQVDHQRIRAQMVQLCLALR